MSETYSLWVRDNSTYSCYVQTFTTKSDRTAAIVDLQQKNDAAVTWTNGMATVNTENGILPFWFSTVKPWWFMG